MIQKTTWKHFLIIGIKVLILIHTPISCGEVEDEGKITTHFSYKNLTIHTVEINLFNSSDENFKNYTINSGEDISISYSYYGVKTGIGEPFKNSKKIILKFIEINKCVENFPKLKEVKQYDNFSESMYDNSINNLIYNIDSEELNQAIDCN